MNHLLEKEVEAFRERFDPLVYFDATPSFGDHEDVARELEDYFTQALTRIWNAGVADERDQWLQGMRCVGCGAENDNELSDTCAECFEED